jgi:hypothetical protein
LGVTWNVRSLYRASSLVTIPKELSKYKLDLVQVRWEGGGTELAEYTFFSGKENDTLELDTVYFFAHKRIIAVKRVQYVSDRMSYITLRGHWCLIIVLSIHAQTG